VKLGTFHHDLMSEYMVYEPKTKQLCLCS